MIILVKTAKIPSQVTVLFCILTSNRGRFFCYKSLPALGGFSTQDCNHTITYIATVQSPYLFIIFLFVYRAWNSVKLDAGFSVVESQMFFLNLGYQSSIKCIFWKCFLPLWICLLILLILSSSEQILIWTNSTLLILSLLDHILEFLSWQSFPHCVFEGGVECPEHSLTIIPVTLTALSLYALSFPKTPVNFWSFQLLFSLIFSIDFLLLISLIFHSYFLWLLLF